MFGAKVGTMQVDQMLIDAAVQQAVRRWPEAPSAVGAAIYLSDGSVLTGVPLNNFNAAMTLCAETGPIAQAWNLGQTIVASVCVERVQGRADPVICAPCGACQERLALWGPDVHVGDADGNAPGGWASRTLAEVNPYYWAAVYAEIGPWPSMKEHAWGIDE